MCRKILIIDDDSLYTRALIRKTYRHDFQFFTADSIKRAKAMIKLNQFDLVLANVKVPGGRSLSIKKLLQETSPGTAIIFMSGIKNDFQYMQSHGEPCCEKQNIDQIVKRCLA